jgi:hypothetical protein
MNSLAWARKCQRGRLDADRGAAMDWRMASGRNRGMSISETPTSRESSNAPKGHTSDAPATAPRPRRPTRAELIWEGKYDADGRREPAAGRAAVSDRRNGQRIDAGPAARLLLRPGFREEEWRNRLVWGDKKYVLPSLLSEFAGKVNLIYIDPPFDTGADFSFTATVPRNLESEDEASLSFTKEPSIIEHKAYRDTWGRGLESYLQWFYETVALLQELLHRERHNLCTP